MLKDLPHRYSSKRTAPPSRKSGEGLHHGDSLRTVLVKHYLHDSIFVLEEVFHNFGVKVGAGFFAHILVSLFF